MPEEFLHYIWLHQLFDNHNLISTTNERIEIITPGSLNTDSGPDFENARIKIDKTIWAGNIEIHTDSSNWGKHKHHTNQAYNNVILHIVSSYSKPAITEDGKVIPTVVLPIDSKLIDNYNYLKTSSNKIACSEELDCIDSFTWNNWLDRMGSERLEDKTDIILGLLKQNNNNWEESFYIILAKSFGFKTNALPFEMMARLTPLKLLAKYSSQLFQLEALLFGQSGLLDATCTDDYAQQLLKEYNYLKKIHSLKPVDKYLWKFMRLRPSNFPTIRMAQFASLIHNSNRLFSKILDARNITELQALINCTPNKYWENHYSFGKESAKAKKVLGKSSINSLLINTVIPFIFIYGKARIKQEYCALAIEFLEQLPAEKNSILTNWSGFNVNAKNSFQSQALIQLFNTYCIKKNCLYCHIGNTIIKTRLS